MKVQSPKAISELIEEHRIIKEALDTIKSDLTKNKSKLLFMKQRL